MSATLYESSEFVVSRYCGPEAQGGTVVVRVKDWSGELVEVRIPEGARRQVVEVELLRPLKGGS